MPNDYAHLKERGLTQEIAYNGKVFRVRIDTVALPNGEIAQREIAEHPGAVAIVPLTDAGEVLLVRQFRYAIGQISLELPAGKLDVPGEAPAAAAVRELHEETGCTGAELIYLGRIHSSPGFTNEVLHLFAATGFSYGAACTEPDEFVELARMTIDQACEAVRRGEITDAKTIAGLLWVRQFGLDAVQQPPAGTTLMDPPTS